MERAIPTRMLGKTGLRVSALSLGTVSLGLDYGLPAPDGFGRPDEQEAARVVSAAIDAGINLFDTAPAYGEAERLLGVVLGGRPDCFIATKISIVSSDGPTAASDIRTGLQASLDQSRRNLRRSVLDIVQIHNATVPLLTRGEVLEGLLTARREGTIRLLGASVYTEEEALAVIRCGCFDVLQVAYNLLDQKMAKRVFAAASEAGVALILRSALLKGALTEKAQWLPPELTDLRAAVERLKDRTGTWQQLTRLAYRFCLSVPEASSVLVGARTVGELDEALRAAECGALDPSATHACEQNALGEEWLNPSHWNLP